ncbi:hypothetical protein D3C81_1087790 [compost metagenome]
MLSARLAPDLQFIALPANQLQEEGVERPRLQEADILWMNAGQNGNPVPHLLGSLAGEGKQQDFPRIYTSYREQVASAADQD